MSFVRSAAHSPLLLQLSVHLKCWPDAKMCFKCSFNCQPTSRRHCCAHIIQAIIWIRMYCWLGKLYTMLAEQLEHQWTQQVSFTLCATSETRRLCQFQNRFSMYLRHLHNAKMCFSCWQFSCLPLETHKATLGAFPFTVLSKIIATFLKF